MKMSISLGRSPIQIEWIQSCGGYCVFCRNFLHSDGGCPGFVERTGDGNVVEVEIQRMLILGDGESEIAKVGLGPEKVTAWARRSDHGT